MTEKETPYWSEEADEHLKWHAPEGTFTQTAPQIVKILLNGADGNPVLALRRLVFYMNRAGDKLSNTQALNSAKRQLEKLEKSNH